MGWSLHDLIGANSVFQKTIATSWLVNDAAASLFSKWIGAPKLAQYSSWVDTHTFNLVSDYADRGTEYGRGGALWNNNRPTFFKDITIGADGGWVHTDAYGNLTLKSTPPPENFPDEKFKTNDILTIGIIGLIIYLILS